MFKTWLGTTGKLVSQAEILMLNLKNMHNSKNVLRRKNYICVYSFDLGIYVEFIIDW